MQTSDTGATAPEQSTDSLYNVPTTEPASRWEDYVDVFLSPAALFRRRAGDRVKVPLITLLVLAVVLGAATMPATAMIMRESMAQAATDPNAAEFMSRMGTIMAWFGSLIGGPVGYLFIVVGSAVLLRLGAWLTDVRLTFDRAMLIATYAATVLLLGQVVVSAIVLFHGEAGLSIPRDTSLGVLRFVATPDLDPVRVAILGRFELFTIWQAVLWAVGLIHVAGAGRGRAIAIAVGAWVLTAGPGLIGALVGSAASAAAQ